MKGLLVLAMLAMSAVSFAEPMMTEGPRVVGNGGGGVKKNGVYQTFHSAGIYISEEMTEVPGGELYTSTIMSFSGENNSIKDLVAAGLPYGNRKFYQVEESKMDDKAMARLIAEYARVVEQPVEGLTIFAVTDIEKKATYLLPSFFKLNEVEQASILFHEAYWILNPSANYTQVIAAEVAFQRYVEAQASGKFDAKLPRILGTLLKDPTLPLKTGMKFDSAAQTIPELIKINGRITVGAIFLNGRSCSVFKKQTTTTEKNAFGREVVKTADWVRCVADSNSVQYALEYSKAYPNSIYFKELVNFLASNNVIEASFAVKTTDKPVTELFGWSYSFERWKIDQVYDNNQTIVRLK